jgi:hypothetical protein
MGNSEALKLAQHSELEDLVKSGTEFKGVERVYM